MVFFAPESQQTRHRVIDETLDITREMLQDQALSGGSLGQLAVEQLFIIDNYFFVPNMSGNRLVTPRKNQNDRSIAVFAVANDEEVVRDSNMPIMHAREKEAVAAYAAQIGAKFTRSDIDKTNHLLKQKFTSDDHSLSLPTYMVSGAFIPAVEIEIEKFGEEPPISIPKVVLGTPLVLLSTDSHDPVKRGLRATHDLHHIQQTLTEPPIEPAVVFDLSNRRESEVEAVTGSIAKALRRKSKNSRFRGNPILK